MDSKSKMKNCIPNATPYSKLADKVKCIMDFNRDINAARSRIPGLIYPHKIARSQSVREKMVTTTNFSITDMVEKNSAATINEVNEEESVSQIRTRNLAPMISQISDKIRKTIETFSTVISQQHQGPNYSASWSWIRNFNHFETNTSKEPCDWTRYKIYREFYVQIRTCSSILEQIRHDFLEGLQEYEPGNAVDKVCQEMTLIRSGARGRNTISVAQVPYMKDIFESELTKQKKYAKWMGRTLSDPKDVKKRNELASWLISTSRHLGYSLETVHMAVYFMDAYLTIKGNKLSSPAWGLLGIAALHIAGKLEEPDAVEITRLRRLSCQFYKKAEIEWMERDILTKLKFDVYPPLAPLFANMVLFSGSLEFPTLDLRKVVRDLCMGILHNSLLDHRLFPIPPVDKAKAALEIAVEFIFYQYNVYSKRDMSANVFDASNPGKSMGNFAIELCTDTFMQRFVSRNIRTVIPAVICTASPVRNIKA